jgi:hypothetical protein
LSTALAGRIVPQLWLDMVVKTRKQQKEAILAATDSVPTMPQGRVLAYGYSNHETQETYQYIFEALKRESTQVLKDRFATGRPVYL